MNDQNSFETLLSNGLGLTVQRARNAIILYGFDTCRGLVDTSTDGLKAVFDAISRENRNQTNARQVTIREQIKQRFFGIRSELIMRANCGGTIDNAFITGLTVNDVDILVNKHNEWKLFKEAASNMTLPSVKIPALTKSNWKEFSQSMKELLTRQRGTYNVPLIYVIRAVSIGNYDDVYSSTEEQLITCLNLTGGNFKSDNSSVWSLLSEHAMGTEAESIVQRQQSTRNGRRSWLALMAHMESTSYLDNLKSGAMASLSSATYSGEKKNFGIVKYFTIHSNAHNDLETAGEPLTHGMKITHFLQGLKEDTAMNFAISTKAEPQIVTFEDFYNSFSAKLTTKLTLTQQNTSSSQRHINAIDTNRNTGRGEGRGGRGRGNRGGGRGNRGGRGRGRGRVRGGRGGRNRYNPLGDWRPRTGEYSNDEWTQLSYDQRQRVHDLRSFTQSDRTVSQVSTDGGSVPRDIDLPPASTRDTPPQQPRSDGSGSTRGTTGRVGDAFSQSSSRR